MCNRTLSLPCGVKVWNKPSCFLNIAHQLFCHVFQTAFRSGQLFSPLAWNAPEVPMSKALVAEPLGQSCSATRTTKKLYLSRGAPTRICNCLSMRLRRSTACMLSQLEIFRKQKNTVPLSGWMRNRKCAEAAAFTAAIRALNVRETRKTDLFASFQPFKWNLWKTTHLGCCLSTGSCRSRALRKNESDGNFLKWAPVSERELAFTSRSSPSLYAASSPKPPPSASSLPLSFSRHMQWMVSN